MKVMIINSLYYPNIIGGAEKSTQVLAENLGRFGVEPVVVTISDMEKTDYVNGVRVHYIHHSNIYWSYYSKTQKPWLKIFWHLLSLYNIVISKKLADIIRSEEPDIVHTNNLSEFSVGIWKVIKKNKIPLVHTLRDYSLICPRAILFKKNNVCRKKNPLCRMILNFRKFFSKYPDAVVGNSHFIINEHLREGYFKNSRKYVIYSALESSRINRAPVDKKDIEFGYIGQLSQHKGIEFLLNTFKESNIADLHIFGKGITEAYEDYLKNKYKSGRIFFHGFVKTEEALNKIDILVVPSLWFDPLPRVIFEAYSYGIPVIGSNRGGTPEIIDEGKTGFIFNPESGEDLVSKVQLFQNNPETIIEMSAYCIKKAEGFLPDKVLKEYIDIYKYYYKKGNTPIV